MSTSTYDVVGMTCGHCAGSVKEEVGQITGVTGVEVDLAGGKVTVTGSGPLDDGQIRAAVEEAGYEMKG